MNVVIQQAGLQDLDALTAWRIEVLRDVFSLPADADTSALERANREYYRMALPNGAHIACFAVTNDGDRVGCGGLCLQREMPSPDNPSGRCAYLMNVYVRPTFRHQHIGAAMVGWLVTQAHSHDADKIYLETSDAARSLYSGLGFQQMNGMMKLKQYMK